jgi:hypothetical protein
MPPFHGFYAVPCFQVAAVVQNPLFKQNQQKNSIKFFSIVHYRKAVKDKNGYEKIFMVSPGFKSSAWRPILYFS